MTVITVRDDVAPRPISPDLWGVFFEDINYAGDGGLYAELVANGSFSWSRADHAEWGAFTSWRRSGRVEVHDVEPLSEQAPRFARLLADGSPAALTNEGFDGIVVENGEDYLFSVFARSPEPVDLVVCLPDASDPVTIQVTSTSWTRYDAVLTASATAAHAGLRLEITAGSVDVDFVSLFPRRTFGEVQGGLRADLAGAVADLRPRFVRFPGGCVAHGLGLRNIYRWKDTIGPRHERRQNFNLWGYHQSMGLGYFEYFQYCEQIGASPMPILAAGVTCQNLDGGAEAIPADQMDDYIADVLDLIEFANGAATSTWGAVRAELGHPEPFGLKYLGIGNEDQITDEFRERFAAILHAVKTAHPEIQVIGTAGPAPFGTDFDNGWDFARELDVPIVDEHMYRTPKWFFENTHRYDSYDRDAPKVYIGEYAAKGNKLINALAEAAFMVGLEHNGDVVSLASYAPLFGKVGHSQWVPDMIYFDNSRVLPSLSYHVQQMFAASAGDRLCPVEITDAPRFERAPQAFSGLEFETQGFDVRFTDIELNGEAAEDRVLPAGRSESRGLRTDDPDYVVSFTATALSGDPEGSFAVHFGAVGTGESLEWNFGTWRNKSLCAFYTADGVRGDLMEGVPFHIEIGRAYHAEIRVRERGKVIEFRLDGELVQTWTDPQTPEERFSASAVADSATGRRWIHLVNATGVETPTQVALSSGRPPTVREARTLAGAWDAGAPFEAAPFAPEPLEAEDGQVTLPPYSLTVVELEA